MGSFFVFLSDEEGMKTKLKSSPRRKTSRRRVLALDNKTGPENYKIAKDAEVTVVLVTRITRCGELTPSRRVR